MNALLLMLASGGGWDNDGPWWIFGPLFGLFWIALIIGVIWFASRRFRPPERSDLDRARGILAERYARGEISSEEYRARLSDLQ